MTLIVSLLTHDLAIQVSDRRYSFVRADGTIDRREDDHNKAVLLCGRVAIGFTGLGVLNRKHTDDWILAALSDERCTTAHGAASTLQKRTIEAFRQAPQSSYFGEHTVVGVGWEPETNLPILFHVSNSQDENGQPTQPTAGSFAIYRPQPPGENSFSLSLAGDAPSQERIDELRKRLRDTPARLRIPVNLADLLARFVLARANESELVGNRLMLVSLPRKALMPHGMIINGPPSMQTPSFLYLGPKVGDVQQFGPHCVCGEVWAANVKISVPNE